ncbi:MAG: transposase [Desulfobacterales bacterium]|nr:transposase [Desulfobacterales bacterium]
MLFHNRYKSILCEEEAYLLALVRYIHLNPLRAGAVQDIEALRGYPRCGHSALMGTLIREWQDTDYVLRFFGSRLRTARGAYERFVVEGVDQGRRPELVGGGLIRSAGGWSAMGALRASGMRIMGDERILGNGEFVQAALDHTREQYEKKTLARAKGLTLEMLLGLVAQQMGLVPGDLSSTGRNRAVARARAIVCALAVEHSGISGRDLSRQLNLSPSAVSKLVRRGRKDSLTADLAKTLLRVDD